MFEVCRAVDETRGTTGIASYLDACTAAGVPRALRYSMYVNGLDPDGSELTLSAYLERGAALGDLQTSWLAL